MVQVGFFIDSRQYICQSVSAVLVCWFEIQVLDAVKWLLLAFSIVRVFLFDNYFIFFFINIPKTVLVPVSI